MPKQKNRRLKKKPVRKVRPFRIDNHRTYRAEYDYPGRFQIVFTYRKEIGRTHRRYAVRRKLTAAVAVDYRLGSRMESLYLKRRDGLQPPRWSIRRLLVSLCEEIRRLPTLLATPTNSGNCRLPVPNPFLLLGLQVWIS